MTHPGGVLTVRDTCRGCGGRNLHKFLDLGEVPLANSFLTPEQIKQIEQGSYREPRFPLEVCFCADCWLVQLRHVVSPEVLFSNYLYRTGTNATIVRHNAELSASVVESLKLGAKDLVVEIASNDGSLLSAFRDRGVRTLGVEPAKNIAVLARQAGIDTINEFFDAPLAARMVREHGPAGAVLANNVLAHVDATAEFLAACRALLSPTGRVIIEAPYLAEMLSRFEYDTVYHEHLCYFAVRPLMRLFERAGLDLERVDRVEIHGGSLRLWGRPATGTGHGAGVLEMAEREREAGFGQLGTYRIFAEQVARNRQQLLDILRGWRAAGKSVAGYGAPAKGNTLLCYCGIDSSLLPWTVDRSPLKIGMLTPGSQIPVYPVERLLHEPPDFVFILAWNFAAEIMEFLQPLRDRGTRILLPIPEPRIL